MVRWARSVTLTAALAVVPTMARLDAQQATLENVDRMARSGQADSARVALTAWWEAGYDAADREVQQRALWLRARLTSEPEEAMRDYQRLVVLYPGGAFTDQALYRMAQAAHALGDGPQARTHVEALVRDYPGSPVRRPAEAWLASAGEAPRPREASPSGAGATPARAAAEAGREAPPRAAPASVAPAGRYYALQLGAFGEEERARAVASAAIEAGFDVRIVRVEGSPFLHVRVGTFAERPEAVEVFNRLARAGVQAALVQDERAERAFSP